MQIVRTPRTVRGLVLGFAEQAHAHVVATAIPIVRGVQRLMNVADEMDKPRQRAQPLLICCASLAKQPLGPLNCARGAIAVRAIERRRGRTDWNVVVVPRRLIGVGANAAHAIRPGG